MRDQKINSLLEEVDSIYAKILAADQEARSRALGEKEVRSKLKTWNCLFPVVIVIVVLCLAIYNHFSPSDLIRTIAVLVILFGYIVFFVLQIIELIADLPKFKSLLTNANSLLIEGLRESAESDTTFSLELKGYSPEAISLVRNRIQSRKSAIECRVGLLVGSIEKVGMIPGLIVLYISAVGKIAPSLALSVALVMFLFYSMATVIRASTVRLEFYLIQLGSSAAAE